MVFMSLPFLIPKPSIDEVKMTIYSGRSSLENPFGYLSNIHNIIGETIKNNKRPSQSSASNGAVNEIHENSSML